MSRWSLVFERISLDTAPSNGTITIMGVTEHAGIVRTVHGTQAEIVIPREGLPEHYRSRSALPASARAVAHVWVPRLGRDLDVGQEVAVLLEERPGIWPVCWTVLFPLAIFGGAFGFFFMVTANKAASAVSGVVLLFPYYSFLWVLRSYWKSCFSFRLK